jgi:hypothetical protein
MLPVSTSPPMRIFTLAPGFRRGLLAIPLFLALLGTFFVARWCLGSTFAQTARDRDVAQLAVSLAPSDPQTHYTLGKLTEASLDQADLEVAVREYEAATRAAPDDYRLWLILGSARERSGDTAGAEPALRRALALAPAYGPPRWALGNLLLRQGRAEEASVFLAEAGESTERFRRPVLGLLSSYYGSDPRTLLAAIGPRRELRRDLVQFLIDRGDPEGASVAWDELKTDERTGLEATGDNLIATLAAAHRYTAAYSIYTENRSGDSATLNRIENPGFEADIETGGSNVFGWRVSSEGQPQVALDRSQRQSGNSSLTLVFNADGTVPLHDVVQLLAVAPASSFKLTYAVRMLDLKGSGTVEVQILNAANGTLLAHSAPAAPGSHDWQVETLEFTTPPQVDGIILRIAMMPCQSEVCPLYGQFWYDDFQLQRIGTADRPQG